MTGKSESKISNERLELLADTLMALNAMTVTVRALLSSYTNPLVQAPDPLDAVVQKDLCDKLVVIETAIQDAADKTKSILQVSLKNPAGDSSKIH